MLRLLLVSPRAAVTQSAAIVEQWTKPQAWPAVATTLEAWATNASVDCGRLRLVSIDVEGFELDIIESSQSFLRRCGSPDVLLAVHPHLWFSLPGGHVGIGAWVLRFMATYPHVYGEDLVEIPATELTSAVFEHNDAFLLSTRLYADLDG
jgi:hypothetical protein